MKSVRDYALRGLFALSLAWAFLVLGMSLFDKYVGLLNPVPEGSNLHMAMENWTPILVAVVAAAALLSFLVKFKPGFLIIPRQVTSLRLWITLFMTTIIVGITLLVVLVVVTMMLDPPGPNPENVHYISLMFWLPMLATVVITPAASVFITWTLVINR